MIRVEPKKEDIAGHMLERACSSGGAAAVQYVLSLGVEARWINSAIIDVLKCDHVHLARLLLDAGLSEMDKLLKSSETIELDNMLVCAASCGSVEGVRLAYECGATDHDGALAASVCAGIDEAGATGSQFEIIRLALAGATPDGIDYAFTLACVNAGYSVSVLELLSGASDRVFMRAHRSLRLYKLSSERERIYYSELCPDEELTDTEQEAAELATDDTEVTEIVGAEDDETGDHLLNTERAAWIERTLCWFQREAHRRHHHKIVEVTLALHPLQIPLYVACDIFEQALPGPLTGIERRDLIQHLNESIARLPERE